MRWKFVLALAAAVAVVAVPVLVHSATKPGDDQLGNALRGFGL